MFRLVTLTSQNFQVLPKESSNTLGFDIRKNAHMKQSWRKKKKEKTKEEKGSQAKQ